MKSALLSLLLAGLAATLMACGEIGGGGSGGGSSAGWVEGTVKDASTQDPIASATVSVAGSTYSVFTDGTGTYKLERPAGTYTLTIAKTGYHSATFSNVIVRSGETNTLDAVLFIASTRTGDGTVAGIIKNAFTGNGEGGVQLNFRSGLNTRQGNIVKSATTASSGANVGYYELVLPTGYYTAEAVKQGFVTAYFNIISIGGITTGNQNFSITPVVAENVYRIVLTWGESPSDLDSHLTGPAAAGGRFHIWYQNQNYRDSTTSANLDVDDITSFGPETITLTAPVASGIYRYSVHNYSDRSNSTSTRLSNVSRAKVTVYRGSTLLREFTVPSGQTGTIWRVFELENNTIRPINRIFFINTEGAEID
jgi:5-hydroxyisourate hydrolase-like protein (transthyretin family)